MGKRTDKQQESPDRRSSTVSPVVLARVYLLVLGVALLVAAGYAWRHTAHIEEFPQASDSFGYLQGAQDIRRGQAPHGGQKFTAESAHARLLVETLAAAGIPLEDYESMVGPNAYHYEARSGKIINQYPPGVPLMLAVFPAGRALAAWYTVAIGLIVAAGIGALVLVERRFVAARRVEALIPAALFVLAMHLALLLLGTTVSYSVDFLVLALLPAIVLSAGATGRSGTLRAGLLLALGAGLALGFAVLMRVAAVLFVPGFVAMLWPRSSRRWPEAGRLAGFVTGLLLAGVAPLLVHQTRLTGSPLVSTYARADVAGPTLEVVPRNLDYYFNSWQPHLGDAGDRGNIFLLTAVLAFAAACAHHRLARRPLGSLWRWLIGAGLAWGIPTAYFLTHPITTPYYQLPTVLATMLMLAVAAWRFSADAGPGGAARAGERAGGGQMLLAAAFLPALVHVGLTCLPPKIPYGGPMHERVFNVPEPLRESRAWVFADRYSGTFWYRAGILAQSVAKGSPQARYLLYRLGHQRGEPQYVVQDNATMAKEIVPEIMRMGGSFEVVGVIDPEGDRTGVARVIWPEGGPRELR